MSDRWVDTFSDQWLDSSNDQWVDVGVSWLQTGYVWNSSYGTQVYGG